jgi:hypothetical protein
MQHHDPVTFAMQRTVDEQHRLSACIMTAAAAGKQISKE